MVVFMYAEKKMKKYKIALRKAIFNMEATCKVQKQKQKQKQKRHIPSITSIQLKKKKAERGDICIFYGEITLFVLFLGYSQVAGNPYIIVAKEEVRDTTLSGRPQNGISKKKHIQKCAKENHKQKATLNAAVL